MSFSIPEVSYFSSTIQVLKGYAMQVRVFSSDAKTLVDVDLEGIEPDQYQQISDVLEEGLKRNEPAYNAVAQAMITAIQLCPDANPADLWVHLLYHQYRHRVGRNDQSWKRVSGDAFEHVLRTVYGPRLNEHGIILRRSKPVDAAELGLLKRGIGSSKTDLILEKTVGQSSQRFGVIHCKASLAERLSDDAPASVALIEQGYWSVEATLDAKMYPPPHGDAVVWGELGYTARGDKRGYFEVAGQFNACYSFNTRTPPSKDDPSLKARIHSLKFTEEQPDILVRDILEASRQYPRL